MARSKRKKFTDVDVWQKVFSPISEQAVYDVYSKKYNIEEKDMYKHNFTKCVEALRNLDCDKFDNEIKNK